MAKISTKHLETLIAFLESAPVSQHHYPQGGLTDICRPAYLSVADRDLIIGALRHAGCRRIDTHFIVTCERCGEPIKDGEGHFANYGEPPGYDVHSNCVPD